jgi:FAD/FMN-containing dehydrogenase
MEYLDEELGSESVNLMRTIKRALDPNLILNPGKIFVMDP